MFFLHSGEETVPLVTLRWIEIEKSVCFWILAAERKESLKLVGRGGEWEIKMKEKRMRTLLLSVFVTLNMRINSVIAHISK